MYVVRVNKSLGDNFSQLAEVHCIYIIPGINLRSYEPCYKPDRMKKYLSEKNALTVMVSLFCLIMMIISLVKNQSIWQVVAFALAFSFSVELICHRAKENK